MRSVVSRPLIFGERRRTPHGHHPHHTTAPLAKGRTVGKAISDIIDYVSRTAISKWESGKGYPNIESLKCISKFFSVTIDELLSAKN